MKYIYIIFIFISSKSIAQTALIRHKSHSGTNKTFVPAKIRDNFGEVVINREYEEDKTSTYKLISEGFGSDTTFILFQTKNKSLDRTMCMIDDTVLQTVEINDGSLVTKTKIFLIELLKDYRKKEKEQEKSG